MQLSRPPFLLRAYQALGATLEPLTVHLLYVREKRGKEVAERLGERRGFASLSRPSGSLIWCHAASVGEMISILPLIKQITQQGCAVLVTTGTVTSAKIAATRLPKGAFHQFIPLDTPQAVKRFYGYWQPHLALFCESELWPTLTLAAHQRGIPLGVLNGRMSLRSFGRWQSVLLRPVAHALLAPLTFCLAQSVEDAARYEALGAPALAVGNLKYDAPPLPVEAEALAELRSMIGARPVFLAASTHPGEEEAIIAAAKQVMAAQPDLLTIIVPRHPDRAGEILAIEPGAISRRAGGVPHPAASFYLADTMGELGLFYRLATCAFIGGSLVPHGGQNPIEAAKLGCPILHGAHTRNFNAIYADFDGCGAALAVADGADLSTKLTQLLVDAPGRHTMVALAHTLVARQAGALERTWQALVPHLAAIKGKAQ